MFLTLAIDTGSPRTSVALGSGARVLAHRESAGGRSSRKLLTLVDEVLQATGKTPPQLDRVIACRGPGSFTGLRVGLASVLGLYQALDVEATAVGTLSVLAHAARRPDDRRPVICLVDALRDEWFAQTFDPDGKSLDMPEIVPARDLVRRAPCRMIGFDVGHRLDALADGGEIELVDVDALAPTLLRIAAESELQWDPARLVMPLYLRPPAASGL